MSFGTEIADTLNYHIIISGLHRGTQLVTSNTRKIVSCMLLVHVNAWINLDDIWYKRS